MMSTFFVISIKIYVGKLRSLTGVGDANVAETRGFALSMPTAKNVQKLATRDALHGSRPNLFDSDRRVELCPPPVALWIQVRARRDMPENRGKNGNFNYAYTGALRGLGCSPRGAASWHIVGGDGLKRKSHT